MKLNTRPLLFSVIFLLSLAFARGQETPPSPPPPAVTGTAASTENPPLPGTPAGVAEETPAPSPETDTRIVDISLRGNEHIATSDIMAAIKSRPGDLYDSKKAEADRQAVWDLGWFSHVEVTPEPVTGGITLTFRVEENEIIKGVEISEVKVPKPTRQQLTALLKTKSGQVANHNYLAADIDGVNKAFADQGYIFTVVGGRELTDQGIVKLTMLEGKIVELRITGNKKTKTNVISREVRSQPGTIYNARQVGKDQERVFNLGFMENVLPHAEIGPDPGTVILVMEVVEKKHSNMATVGGGWASAGGFVGTVDVSTDNLRGTGQRASVRGSFGSTTSYEVGYFNPWIASGHTTLNLALYNRLTAQQVVKQDTNDTINYDERRAGGKLTFGRPLSDTTNVFLSLRRDDLKVENIQDSTISPDDPIFNAQSVSSLGLRTVHNTSDIARNPTQGALISLEAEVAGLSGAKFSKYGTDLRRYLAFGPGARNREADLASRLKRKVFAVRLKVGKTTGDTPYLEQFLIGGSDTLRGYKDDRFVGTSMLLLNTEFRIPLNDTLQGVLFADAGDAWGGTFADTFGDASFKLHSSVGVGINVQSPLGPLRLQYGIGSEGGQLHFGFGQTF
jgi:outer membrane protein insertion porin family